MSRRMAFLHLPPIRWLTSFYNPPLKYKFGNRHFWAEGYYVSTVGLNESTIKKYIRDQEKHDMVVDKLTTVEYSDPFKGKVK